MRMRYMEVNVVLPHLVVLSLSNSPHARSLSLLRQQEKKDNKQQCCGRNAEDWVCT